MKTKSILLTLVCGFLMAAQCAPEEPLTAETEYELVSLELSYPEINQAGGTVSPSLTYEYIERFVWSDGKVDVTHHQDGAKVTYAINGSMFSIDANGKVSAATANESLRPLSTDVTVTLKVCEHIWKTTASVIQNGFESIIDYSDLAIEEFSYSALPSTGGEVVPTLKYSYCETITRKDGTVETTTISDGAVVSFSSETEGLTVNEETGVATVPLSDSFESRSFTISVSITLPDGNSMSATTELVVDAREDYVADVITVQLPIELGPHISVIPVGFYPEVTYNSISKDGRPVETENYPFNKQRGVGIAYKPDYESVAAGGADIPFSGGELATISTWASGKRDTLIIAKPEFSAETSYRFVPESLEHALVYTVEDESLKPTTSIEGNIWHIHQLGAQQMKDIIHTLRASVDGHETSLTIYQNNNVPASCVMLDLICEIGRVKDPFITRLQNFLDFDDYRPGGQYYDASAKWARTTVNDGGQTTTVYCPGWATSGLHQGDDANRFVDLYLNHACDTYGIWERTYVSGITAQEKGRYFDNNRYTSSWFEIVKANITAVASVKMKDGSIRDITHKWEWTSHPKHGWTYGIFIPTVKDAAEDFEWTVTLDISFDDSICKIVWDSPDYSKLHASFKIKDSLETFDDFCASQGINGPFASPETEFNYGLYKIQSVTPLQHGHVDWEMTADIADGLTAEEYMNTPYEQLPGR